MTTKNAPAEGSQPLTEAKPLFYNYDGWNTCLLGADDSSIEWNLKLLFETGVTTLALSPNIGQAFLCRPGTDLEMIHGGIPPSQADLDAFISQCWPGGSAYVEAAAAVVRRWAVEGVDPYEVALSKGKEMGLRVFISYRLNDTHTLANCPAGPYSDSFYREHPEWRINSDTLDFANVQVREKRIAQIRELAGRYGMVDGIEIDFLRRAPYFNASDASAFAPLMSDFVSQVATVIAALANADRPLQLIVRVPSSLEGCMMLGLDPLTWARNGYIDAITLGRFLRLTADMEVEVFKQGAGSVPVYGCLEYLLSLRAPRVFRHATAEAYRGVASALYARGADGLYLYNMYASRTEDPPLVHFEPFAVLNQLASPELLACTNQLFLVPRHDDVDQTYDIGLNVSLPAQLKGDTPLEAELYVGTVNPNAVYVLRIVAHNLDLKLKVELNGHSLDQQTAGTSPTLFPELYNQQTPSLDDCLDFRVSPDFLVTGRNVVVVQGILAPNPQPIEVDAIELAAIAPQEITPEILVVFLTTDHARVSFSGLGGSRYKVERSTDLTNWYALATITMPPDGVYTYCDSAPPQVAASYRAVSELSPAVIPSNIVAWWRGQDTSDDSIGGNHGSPQGGARFINGKVGRAFFFNGISSFITLANNASMDFRSGDFTIEVWCRFDSLAHDQTILHKVTGLVPNDQTYFLEASGPPDKPSLRFMVRDTETNQNDLVAPVRLVTGLWYHIAAVRAGNTNSLYLNGVLVGSQEAGLSADTGPGGIAQIGNIAPNGVIGVTRFFNGGVDELSLYSRALSASEIEAIHNADSAGKLL